MQTEKWIAIAKTYGKPLFSCILQDENSSVYCKHKLKQQVINMKISNFRTVTIMSQLSAPG